MYVCMYVFMYVCMCILHDITDYSSVYLWSLPGCREQGFLTFIRQPPPEASRMLASPFKPEPKQLQKRPKQGAV